MEPITKLDSLKLIILAVLNSIKDDLDEMGIIQDMEEILTFMEKNMKDDTTNFIDKFEYDVFTRNENGTFRTGTIRMSPGDTSDTPFRAECYKADYTKEQIISDEFYDICSDDKMNVEDCATMEQAAFECVNWLNQEGTWARVFLDKYENMTRVEAIEAMLKNNDPYCIVKVEDGITKYNQTKDIPDIVWFDRASAKYLFDICTGRIRTIYAEDKPFKAEVFLGAVYATSGERNDKNKWVELEEGSYVAVFSDRMVVVKGPKFKKGLAGMKAFIKLLEEEPNLRYQIEKPGEENINK